MKYMKAKAPPIWGIQLFGGTSYHTHSQIFHRIYTEMVHFGEPSIDVSLIADRHIRMHLSHMSTFARPRLILSFSFVVVFKIISTFKLEGGGSQHSHSNAVVVNL